MSGGRADILVKNPALCTEQGVTRYSSAWTMVTSTQSGAGWAQIGYDKGDDHGLQLEFFWQSGSCSSTCLNTSFFGNPSVGTKYNFRVERLASDGKVRMKLCDPGSPPSSSCTTYHTTTWDPFQQWSETHVQWFGETKQKSSDMPGVFSERVGFTQIDIKISATWIDADVDPCHGSANSPCGTLYDAYHFAWINSPTSFEIWTAPVDR
jgi:hypothetical protein